MGLTRNEAVARVKAIWGVDVTLGGGSLFRAGRGVDPGWEVHLGVNTHRLDPNGHADCHARCNDLEAKAVVMAQPWRVERTAAGSHTSYPYRVLSGGAGGDEADVVCEVWRKPEAHLIAKAPALLAALKAVVDNHCANEKLFCSTCSPARKLIAEIEEAAR